MSFILDALRKSENDRQRQTGPGVADLRSASARARFPVWAIALGVLLLANIAVVAILVLRNAPVETGERSSSRNAEPPSEPAASVPSGPAGAPPSATKSEPAKAGVSASVFSTEGLNTPAAPSGPAATGDNAGGDVEIAARSAGKKAATPEPEILEPLPTIDELSLQGRVVLPPLHLDIHVYVARPAGRFVFINQRKYKEGAKLPEGPVVDRITREGVVLRYGGNRFLMPRP